MTPNNLIAAMFNIDRVKEIIAKCPPEEIAIICPHWSINKPNYENNPENESEDFREFEQELGILLSVNDYDDLIADPHGILSF